MASRASKRNAPVPINAKIEQMQTKYDTIIAKYFNKPEEMAKEVKQIEVNKIQLSNAYVSSTNPNLLKHFAADTDQEGSGYHCYQCQKTWHIMGQVLVHQEARHTQEGFLEHN